MIIGWLWALVFPSSPSPSSFSFCVWWEEPSVVEIWCEKNFMQMLNIKNGPERIAEQKKKKILWKDHVLNYVIPTSVTRHMKRLIKLLLYLNWSVSVRVNVFKQPCKVFITIFHRIEIIFSGKIHRHMPYPAPLQIYTYTHTHTQTHKTIFIHFSLPKTYNEQKLLTTNFCRFSRR